MTARCQVCGRKIVLIRHPYVITLNLYWVHVNRFVRSHAPVGPS